MKEHPAVVGTVFYAYVSWLGSTYHWMYLRRFEINFFDFAEANDFLTGAFKQPGVIILGLVGLLFAWILIPLAESRGLDISAIRFLFRQMKSVPQHGEIPVNHGLSVDRPHRVLTPIFLLFFSIYAFAPGFGLAYFAAGETRRGWGSYVRVELTRQADTLTNLSDSALMLLGTSDRFVFLWDKPTDQTHVVPSGNLARLSICYVSRGFLGLRTLGGRQAGPCQP